MSDLLEKLSKALAKASFELVDLEDQIVLLQAENRHLLATTVSAERYTKRCLENESLREHLNHALTCRDDYVCLLCETAASALEDRDDG